MEAYPLAGSILHNAVYCQMLLSFWWEPYGTFLAENLNNKEELPLT